MEKTIHPAFTTRFVLREAILVTEDNFRRFERPQRLRQHLR